MFKSVGYPRVAESIVRHEAIATARPDAAAQAARVHMDHVATALSETEFACDREVTAARRLVHFEQARRAEPPRRKTSA